MTLRKLTFPALIIACCMLISGCSYLEKDTDGTAVDSGINSNSVRGRISEEDSDLGSGALNSRGRGQGIGAGGSGRGLGRGPGRGLGGRNRVIVSDSQKAAIGIELATAVYKPVRTELSAVGKVLAPRPRMAMVGYAFPARIAEIHVNIGDWVKPGQVLFTIQSEEVGTAKTAYYMAVAERELAETNLEREKRLFERGVGAQKNLLAVQSELKVANTTLEAAEKKLHVLGFSEEEVASIAETHQISPIIQLFAPIAGKVTEQNALLGEMIDQSTELMTIMDPRILWVDAEIYERDIAKIRVGQQVRVSVPAYPGETFPGKLSYISDKLDDETRTIKVRTEVENRDLRLKPGMFASIDILLSNQSKALVIPAEAVLDDQDEQIVFVEVDGEYVPRVVEVGARQLGFCEIKNGIEEGDRVVTTGNFQLKSKVYEELLGGTHVH